MESHRELIKSEFKYYLAHIARSARRTSEGFNLGKTAVDSFLAFIEPQKLFDYDADKWKHIVSMYDITDCDEVKSIADELLNDEKFIENDNKKNQGWRSGSLMHYVCFINARSFFSCEDKKEKSFPLSNMALQQIYYGAPGTGKSHTIDGIVNKDNSIRTTFHPDSDYSTFVGCYKPKAKEGAENEITYGFVPQAFTTAYVEAWKDTSKPYYLVIEEINRGNCAQIFGDIFQLLDRKEDGMSSYEIKPDTDLEQYFCKVFENENIDDEKIKSGKVMRIPANLFILATMNTSDQSLFPIDSAFKRRWDWKYIPIKDEKENHKIVVGNSIYDWWTFVEIVNGHIEDVTDSEDKQIGYWFAKADANGKISAETLVSKVIFYLWNDVFKDYAHSSNSLFHTDKRKYKFREFYNSNNGEVDLTLLNEFLSGLKWKDKVLQPDVTSTMEEPQASEE